MRTFEPSPSPEATGLAALLVVATDNPMSGPVGSRAWRSNATLDAGMNAVSSEAELELLAAEEARLLAEMQDPVFRGCRER